MSGGFSTAGGADVPVADPVALPVRRPAFTEAHRIVPSRYPPVGIFDKLGDPALLSDIESRTNDRIAEEVGHIGLVDSDDRLVGPGTTPIMAAFTHPGLGRSRFSDGNYGVYYCADNADTAIRESAHHRAHFLRVSNEGPCKVEMRRYVGELQADLHEGLDGALPASVLDPDSYAVSHAWGRALRDAGSYGLTYPSVRHVGGRCAALFRQPAIGPVKQSAHYQFVFDGERIAEVVQLGGYQVL